MCCVSVFLRDWCLGADFSGFPLMMLHMRYLLLGPFHWRWVGTGLPPSRLSSWDGASVNDSVFSSYICCSGTFTAHRGSCVLCVVRVFDVKLSNLLFARNLCSRELRGVSVFASCTPPGVQVPICLQRVSEVARSDRTVALSIPPVRGGGPCEAEPLFVLVSFSTIGDSVWQ